MGNGALFSTTVPEGLALFVMLALMSAIVVGVVCQARARTPPADSRDGLEDHDRG